MRTIIALVLFLGLFSATNLKAQLYCTNLSDAPVWLAIAYNYVPDATDVEISAAETDRWITEGWVYLDVGQTAQLSTHIGFSREYGIKTNFFYYAYQPGGREWRGARKFLIDANPADVDPHSFKSRIEYANQPERYNGYPTIRYAPFKGATEGKEGRFDIVLKQNDENDPMMNAEMKHAFW
ncbi:hypothetical protein C7N43_14905 [Sphingobacteriales bacterium UPWRP_1]|nr:hypothetical protein BVG80_04775 [Sphingobacteriales bacterium TSM_CSM]PSJ76203.1 hypothetical protein C7N43_14905 [Sphingobacteriales bacterium UPWRP_1]